MARTRMVWMALGVLASAAPIAWTLGHRPPIDVVEALGLATGVLSVWLIVGESVWNWPLNIANNLLYLVVFARAGLFADTALQAVCVGLGVLGWYRWLRPRGDEGDGLPVSRLGLRPAAAIGLLVAAGTAAATAALTALGDAAPLPDALAAGLSLLAQYLLTRKLIESWPVAIAAAALYAGIYAWRGMEPTAALNLVLVAASAAGLLRWRKLLPPRPWPSAVPEKSSPAAARPSPPTRRGSPPPWCSTPAPACSCSRS